MNLISKIFAYIKKPTRIINYFGSKGKFKFLSDEMYLKLVYRARMGRRLNLDHPMTFNEKLQWLKLYDRNPEYIRMVDKYEVREYIKQKIGEKYLIPLIGVYDRFEDINFELLPDQFILKCTHDSGGILICKDKSKLNIPATKKIINKYLKRNYYYPGREWPYKNVKPRIVCEMYMVDETGAQIKDYKFFCFHGEPKMMFVASDRDSDIRFDYYDMDFNRLNFTQQDKKSDKPIERPQCFKEMIALAGILSKDIIHIRVDFYEIGGKIYFGELTFFNDSGFSKYDPEVQDAIIGSWMKLPISGEGS